jgi:hypothetical protein
MTTALVMVLLHVLGFRAEPCPTEQHVPDVGACYVQPSVGDGHVTFANGFTIYHRELAQ